MRKKLPNARERFFAEHILIGGEVLTRGEAAGMLQREGVPGKAIDICVCGAKPLTDEELRGLVRAELIFQLRMRYQGMFREKAKKK